MKLFALLGENGEVPELQAVKLAYGASRTPAGIGPACYRAGNLGGSFRLPCFLSNGFSETAKGRIDVLSLRRFSDSSNAI